MPDTYEELQARLQLLGDEKVKNDESIVNINGLLAKADKRRHTEGGNTRKWTLSLRILRIP